MGIFTIFCIIIIVVLLAGDVMIYRHFMHSRKAAYGVDTILQRLAALSLQVESLKATKNYSSKPLNK